MDPRDAGAGHFADGPRDRERPAETGVGVDEKRQLRRARDPARVFEDVTQRCNAKVRQRERHVGHAGAGEIDRLEARMLGETCAVGVDRPGDLQRPLRFDRRAKTSAWDVRGHGGMLKDCGGEGKNCRRSLVRNSLLVFVSVISMFVVACDAVAADEVRRPNILIITVDDMSCDSLGAFGSKLPDTSPNIDRFAAESLRFRYAHVHTGACAPSRNAILSGRYPHNNGVEGFYQVRNINYPVMADLMRGGGYFVAIRHKVAHSTPYHPYKWDLVLDQAPDGTRPHGKDPASYGASTR